MNLSGHALFWISYKTRGILFHLFLFYNLFLLHLALVSNGSLFLNTWMMPGGCMFEKTENVCTSTVHRNEMRNSLLREEMMTWLSLRGYVKGQVRAKLMAASSSTLHVWLVGNRMWWLFILMQRFHQMLLNDCMNVHMVGDGLCWISPQQLSLLKTWWKANIKPTHLISLVY